MYSKIINTETLVEAGVSDIGHRGNLKQFDHYFSNLWNRIDEEWENPSPLINRLIREDYTVYEGPSLVNFLYASNIGEQECEDIKNFFIDTGLKEDLEKALGTFIGVCNIRAYRYTHDPPKEKTHYKDILEGYCVDEHKDGLYPDTYKLMIYKSVDGDVLTSAHGVTEINVSGKWVSPLGLSPTAVLFSSNTLIHRARRPALGRIRDCIEITIMPRKADNFVVISSGAHAGNAKDIEQWEQEI